MLKSESLIQLINSLTRVEKKEFSLYTSKKSDKDYILLYKLIVDNKIIDSLELKKTFVKLRPKSNFNIVVSYLFNLIVEILVKLRKNQDSYYLLFTELLQSRVLYEKSLYDECFNLLYKIKEKARYFENDIVLLLAQRQELNYLLSIGFKDYNEKTILKMHNINRRTIMSIMKMSEHSSLYEILTYRIHNNGLLRSKDEVRKMDDLVTSEINIISNSKVDNFEVRKNHQLFQANYFIAIGDYRSAYNCFIELNKLFECNKHLWYNPPIYYLMTIEGMLESLRVIHNYEGMNYFIDKLEKLTCTSESFHLNVMYIIFIYRLFSYLDIGEFKKALSWVNDNQNNVINKIQLLRIEQQVELSLYLALVYLCNEEYRKANKWLSSITRCGVYQSIPLFRTIRLVSLMVHYELFDFDFIQSESRSIKREILKNKSSGLKVELFLLKFLNYSFVHNDKDSRIKIWNQLKKEVDLLYTDKFELQLIQKFDFIAWVESKVFGIPLAEVLKNKVKVVTFSTI